MRLAKRFSSTTAVTGVAAIDYPFEDSVNGNSGSPLCSASSCLKLSPRYPRLPDDRSQRSDTNFSVIWHGHCRGSFVGQPLHHDMAASLADLPDAVYFKNGTHFSPSQDT